MTIIPSPVRSTDEESDEESDVAELGRVWKSLPPGRILRPWWPTDAPGISPVAERRAA